MVDTEQAWEGVPPCDLSGPVLPVGGGGARRGRGLGQDFSLCWNSWDRPWLPVGDKRSDPGTVTAHPVPRLRTG